MSRKRSRAKSPRLFPLVRQTLNDTLSSFRALRGYQVLPENKKKWSDLSIKHRSAILRKQKLQRNYQKLLDGKKIPEETPLHKINKGLQSVSSHLLGFKNYVCNNRKVERKMVFKSGKLSSHKPREHTLKSLVRC